MEPADPESARQFLLEAIAALTVMLPDESPEPTADDAPEEPMGEAKALLQTAESLLDGLEDTDLEQARALVSQALNVLDLNGPDELLGEPPDEPREPEGIQVDWLESSYPPDLPAEELIESAMSLLDEVAEQRALSEAEEEAETTARELMDELGYGDGFVYVPGDPLPDPGLEEVLDLLGVTTDAKAVELAYGESYKAYINVLDGDLDVSFNVPTGSTEVRAYQMLVEAGYTEGLPDDIDYDEASSEVRAAIDLLEIVAEQELELERANEPTAAELEAKDLLEELGYGDGFFYSRFDPLPDPRLHEVLDLLGVVDEVKILGLVKDEEDPLVMEIAPTSVGGVKVLSDGPSNPQELQEMQAYRMLMGAGFSIRDLEAYSAFGVLGGDQTFALAQSMDSQDFSELGSEKTLFMVETIGIERFAELSPTHIVEAISAIGTSPESEDSISEEMAMDMVGLLSKESIVKLGSARSAELVSFLDGDSLKATGEDQIVAFAEVIVADSDAVKILDSSSLSIIASALDEEALNDIGADGISELIANIDDHDISDLRPTVVSGLIEFLDADYFGDKVISFAETEVVNTFITTNYVAPPDAFLELMESEGVVGIFKGLFR